jgi:ER membrane protein complex subunit 1
MRLLLGLITALSIAVPINALHESEVGIVDWHKSLIGVPLSGSTSTAPVFHRVDTGRETKSVVITATSSNVLAALDPVNGSVGMYILGCVLLFKRLKCFGTIAWRYIFEATDPIAVFKKNKDGMLYSLHPNTI